jgi:hypothetical protein
MQRTLAMAQVLQARGTFWAGGWETKDGFRSLITLSRTQVTDSVADTSLIRFQKDVGNEGFEREVGRGQSGEAETESFYSLRSRGDSESVE